MKLNRRPCPECSTQMEPRLTNISRKRKGSHLRVEVEGIPALVCPKCDFKLIPAKTSKYIDALVDSIFEFEDKLKVDILPVPDVSVNFSFDTEEINTYMGD